MSWNDFVYQITHPFQSLYRYWLYRRTIRTASPHIVKQLSQRWEASHPHTVETMTEEEKDIVAAIQQKTKELNRNNVTRTRAYLAFFQRCPEVHWAFLAHIVSRNGGWNMTDLKGDLIPNLIPPKQIEPLFLFLERANALIFHDAYPQLLLYEESKRRKKPLFHLLPCFFVSSFMKPFWDYFFEARHSALLTVALIINEQQYIQQRVVEDEFFQKHVLSTLPFLVQQWLGMNDVLIPYKTTKQVRLAGITIRDFADVHHRIHIGKTLYGMLFYKPWLIKRAYRFAVHCEHTGSRADFWPHAFSSTNTRHISTIYSPQLEDAWPDIVHHFPDRRDWFEDVTIVKAIKNIPFVIDGDMTTTYFHHLVELQAAAAMKKLKNDE